MNSKKGDPLVSIIIPVYNTEAYLGRCIDSVANQSEMNAEIIMVDDLSTDNSASIIKAAQKKYSNIRYYKMATKGSTGGARNMGLSHASGKYIGFVDSDDWIDTNMYKKMSASLEKFDAEIAVCGVIKENESPYDASYRYKYEIENVLDGHLALELMTRNYNQDISISSIVCNKLYSARFLRKSNIMFVTNNYNDDDVFNYLSFLNVARVVITPNTYYHYYQRHNSITHTFSTKHINDILQAFEIIKTYMDEKNIFDANKHNYYSFFEKCLSFILNILSTTEPSIERQNQYLKVLFAKCPKTLPFDDYLCYFGLQRLRQALTPVIK